MRNALCLAMALWAGCSGSTGGRGQPGGGDSAGSGGDSSGGGDTGSTGGGDTGGGDTGGGDTGGGDTGGGDTGGSNTLRLVNDLTIGEIAVLQGTKVSVMKSGALVTKRNAPVIVGREALVRVYVTPASGYQARPITCTLTLDGKAATTLTSTITPQAASTDDALASTFTFSLPADALTVDTTFSVALTDTSSPAFTGTTSTARFPADGTQAALGALESGKVKVTLVPVQYDYDGSHRLPDTSAANLERFRTTMYENYPVTAVEITVRPTPLVFTKKFDDNAFDTLDDMVMDARSQDDPADDVYYYGVIQPATSFNTYCKSGCVTGQGYVVDNVRDASIRVAAGLGFGDQYSADTFVHEIGHTHGREHAPCDVSGADPDFPYSDGSIGVWGNGILSQKLYAPTKYDDFMGYCPNVWVSDYTFQALFDRVVALRKLVPQALHLGRSRWRVGHVDGAGVVTWTMTVTLSEPPSKSFYPNTHRPGGLVFEPAPLE